MEDALEVVISSGIFFKDNQFVMSSKMILKR